MQAIKVGVIGAGYWGRNHVRVFHELGALAAVCDGDADIREAAEATYAVPTYSTLDELLMTDIDALVIATPASTHDDLTTQALKAGKHVLVEKPAGTVREKLVANIALAEEKGLTLMAGHLLLYHGAFRAMAEAVREGAVGKVLYAYGQRVNLGKIRTDEDVISSLAPHDFSMVHALFGSKPISGSASTIDVIDKPNPNADVAFVTLGFEGDLNAHFHFSWLDPFKQRKLVVVGDLGMAVFDDMEKEEKLRLYDKAVVPQGMQDFSEFQRAIDVRDQGVSTMPFDKSEPLREEALNFLRSAAGEEEPIAGPESALAVLDCMRLVRAN